MDKTRLAIIIIGIFLSPFLIAEKYDHVTNTTSQNISAFYDYSFYRMKMVKKLEDSVDKGGVSQVLSLVQYVTENYLKKCSLLVVLHPSFIFGTVGVNFEVSELYKFIPIPFTHASLKKNENIQRDMIMLSGKSCRGYLLFVKDVTLTTSLLGNHSLSKVVVITTSSRWEIEEYLRNSGAKGIVNLLVVATTGARDIIIKRGEKSSAERFLNLYTHELFSDGEGKSDAHLITSWRKNRQSRNVTFFPPKIEKGFNGRQFAIVASEQAPFVIKKRLKLGEEEDSSVLWDGIELRLLKLLSPFLNYTMQIKEAKPKTDSKGPANVVADEISSGAAEIAVAGVFRTNRLADTVTFSMPHSIDCATFVTRTSTSLPRYRAILGPFHWHVWLALTVTYFIAILPLTYADKHSFKYLWDNPWHIETMFWYVFGTFTNCFTFKGENAWTKSDKHASRMLIGWYWAFSIIVTACYTGSIIAFITLLVFPPYVDSVDQLIEENYRVGTLSTDDWGKWFNNSDHAETKWLLRDIELVPTIAEGIVNVTGSFYLPLLRPYTFLASRSQLEHTLKSNFTLKNKKDVLHVAKDCFVPFGVSLMYPKNAPYTHKLNEYILRAQQSGLIAKVYREMEWELQRSSTGKLLQAGSGTSLRSALVQDRRLTLSDTQGMFLLLGAGHLIAITAFISELWDRIKTKTMIIIQWRPTIQFSQLSQQITHVLQRFYKKPEIIELQPVDEFVFKTYDSRILNSNFSNVKPSVFHSDTQLLALLFKNNHIVRTSSLPILLKPQHTNSMSNSCHQLNCNTFQTTIDVGTECNIRFGSVGSILQSQHCQDLLQYQFDWDRPQTSHT